MRVGFIGLGNMGKEMVRNIFKSGHSVTVYNRTQSRAEELVSEGGILAEKPADACRGDVVITMLADDHATEEVVLGEDGVVSSLAPNTVHICMSTISVNLSERLTEAHSMAGRTYIAAPVFGRPEAAAGAKLFIMAAGPNDVIQRFIPLFESIGQRTFIVGEDPFEANVVKLCGNFLVAAVIESMGEAFALIRKFGVDQERFLDVLTNSIFSSPVYRTYGDIIVRERYKPAGFNLTLALKDMRLALLAAEETNTPMPTLSLIRDRLLTALGRDYGDMDWSCLALLSAENAGLEVRLPDTDQK
jgi:3-hydroxyisobutyrate dehydrogenase-like beta-hydroxyacid dehydrogenase